MSRPIDPVFNESDRSNNIIRIANRKLTRAVVSRNTKLVY